MAMTAALWTLHGLSIELELSRAFLAARLASLAPDDRTGPGGGRSPRWRMARVVRHLLAEKGGTGSLSEETARLRRAQAEAAEIKNAQAAGKLVLGDDVERAAFESARQLRDALLALPSRLGPELEALAIEGGARAIEGALDGALREALQQLADGKEKP